MGDKTNENKKKRKKKNSEIDALEVKDVNRD